MRAISDVAGITVGSEPPQVAQPLADPPDVRGPNGRANAVLAAHWIMDTLGVKRLGAQPRSYAGGAWVPCLREVQGLIELCAGLENTQAFRREVTSHIRTYAPELELDRTGRYLVLLNGTVDFDDGELLAHSPDHAATYRINATFDPKVSREPVNDFIREIAVPGYERRLLQLGAYSLTRWRTLHAMGIILGPPGSGKSTFAAVLTELLRQVGHEDVLRLVSAVSPHTIGTSRFALAAMEDAILNVVPDISRSDVKSIATIKALTGGDIVMIERKGQDPYPKRLEVFPLWMTNGLPAFPDNEGALLRRLKYAETKKPAAKVDPELTQRLTTPEALSAWAAIFVEELWELRQHGFDENDVTRSGLAKFRRNTNTVPRFVAESCVTEPGKTVTTSALWSCFQVWAADAKTGTAMGRQLFNAAVEGEGFVRRKSGVEVWDGLALRAADQTE